MLRRALLVVVVISYLTCVLYLSGLQKTESNVNSLRKSQGRNVNIVNENNENTDTEVLPNRSVANDIEMDKSPRRVSAAELPSEDLGKVENRNHNESNLRDRRTVEVEENVEEASASNEDANSENKHLHIINSDNHTKIIQYTEEKPNLRKVFTFWQKLVSRSQETTPQTLYTKHSTIRNDTIRTTIKITNTTKVPMTTHDKSQSVDLRKSKKLGVKPAVDDVLLGGDFDVMLSEYISKESTRLQPSTTLAPKVKTLPDDETDIFNDLLNAANEESSEMHKINAHVGKYSYEFKYAKFKWPAEYKPPEKKSRKSMQRDKELQDMFVRDFNNLENNILNKPTTQQSSISNEEDDERNTSENTKADTKSSTMPTVLEAVNKVTTSTPLPDMIKQLAENVKNLIIKGLVTTTTDVTTAATTSDLSGNKNYVVIEKIMELLQKYKTESINNVASTTEMAKFIMPSTTAEFRHRKKKKKRTSKKKDNVPPNRTLPASAKLGNLKSIPIISIYLPPQVSSNIATDYKPPPITIQTNLLEIPPLGVPVTNPGSIVSHNIIITTVRPYVQNLLNYPNSYEMLMKNHHTSNRINRAQTRDHSGHKDEGCVDKKKKPKVYRTKDHETIDDSEDEVPMKRHKKNPTRYEDVHGFHEKFEHYQQSHGDIDDLLRDDCSKEDLTQRGPVTFMKRGNDAAFKKLLRSQQRVTDMLEQMLARKNDAPIVETT